MSLVPFQIFKLNPLLQSLFDTNTQTRKHCQIHLSPPVYLANKIFADFVYAKMNDKREIVNLSNSSDTFCKRDQFGLLNFNNKHFYRKLNYPRFQKCEKYEHP